MNYYLSLVFIVCFLLACENSKHTQREYTKTINVFSDLIEYQYLYESTNVENGKIVETFEIKYLSDQLMITAYISKPKGDSKLPALIYCRGGNRDFGTIDRNSIEKQRDLAGEDFVVLASQLRGNVFSQGRDEMGGADLNDILKLIKIAKTLDFVLPDQIGIHGVSRGGRNAYQISRISDEVKSVSVIGTSVDIRDSHSYRPAKYTNVNLPIIGDTIEYRHEYDYRSPIKWVEELNEPLLILHGTDDSRSKVDLVKRIIPLLENHNKQFEYHFIEGGTHALGSHRTLRDSLLVEWHKRFLIN